VLDRPAALLIRRFRDKKWISGANDGTIRPSINHLAASMRKFPR